MIGQRVPIKKAQARRSEPANSGVSAPESVNRPHALRCRLDASAEKQPSSRARAPDRESETLL